MLYSVLVCGTWCCGHVQNEEVAYAAQITGWNWNSASAISLVSSVSPGSLS